MTNNDSAKLRKVAIVTGAAHRIGAKISRELHKHGYNVLIHYRSSEETALQLVEELNDLHADTAMCMSAELQQGSAIGLVEATVEQWGRLDMLVNNASEFYPTPVGQITEEVIQKLFATNLQAPLLLAQAAFPHLSKSGGCVINILDIYSAIAHKEHAVYSASKAALAMLTKSFATDFAPDVRVNGVSPGAILWPEGSAELSETQKQSVLDKIPLERKGDVRDIADAVVYLANAKFVTGQILKVDGGRTL